MSQRLPDVMDEFVRSRRSQGMAKNTIANERKTLDRLLAMLGPVQVRHITERHIDEFMAAMQARGYAPGTLNIDLQCLRNFFNFCVRRGYMRNNVAEHRRMYRYVPKPKLRVPATKFNELLDSCEHPRDRMLIALGLFLWLRDSEAIDLKVGDVNLADGEITVRVFKTRQLDVMPISYELDLELRRWLTFYSEELGEPLQGDMYLCPAKTRPINKDGNRRFYVSGPAHLKPYRKMCRAFEVVQRQLAKIGYDIRDADGRTTREGMHTLRRSGARARFDLLVELGYDGAIREVQAGLHHKNVQTTEQYLGLDLDISRRHRNIRGKPLYGDLVRNYTGNIVNLEERRGQAGHRTGRL